MGVSPHRCVFGASLCKRGRRLEVKNEKKNKFVFLYATPIFSPISKMRLRLTEVGNSIFFVANLQEIKFCDMMLANKKRTMAKERD